MSKGAQPIPPYLGDWGSGQRCRRVYLHTVRDPIPEGNAAPGPRLLVGRDAVTTYRLPGGRHIQLQPAEVLVVDAECWVRPLPSSPFRSFGVIFAPQFIRCYHIDYRHDTPQPPLCGGPREPIVHRRPPDRETEALLRLLLQSKDYAADSLLRTHLAELLLHAAGRSLLQPEIAGGRARATWLNLCSIIDEQLHEPLTREDVARMGGVHPNHLARLFRRFAGCSYRAHLQQRRLERARQLLLDYRLTAAEVAAGCGFQTPEAFSRAFRRAHGLPPGAWRAARKDA